MQAFRSATLLKETPIQVFYCDFATFLKTRILKNISERFAGGKSTSIWTREFFRKYFPDFPRSISFFMFLTFWSSYFQGKTAIIEWLLPLFYKVFTINGNVLYYESHFACRFISKIFSVINVGFHDSKVKTRSFFVIIIGVKPLFSNFAL